MPSTMVVPMKHALHVGALLWSCLAAACSSDTQPGDTSNYAVDGTVVDDRNGHGIAGAKVTFISDALDEASGLSDGSGHYSLVAPVRDGVHFGTLRASAAGYQDSAVQSVYFDGSEHSIELRLRPKGP